MGISALETDYLFLGPLIEARLAAQMPDTPVALCERPEQVLAADRRARVAMVLWGGDRIPGAPGTSQLGQTITQRWLVCLGLNNVGAAADARNAGAGPLLSAIHLALHGWKPDGVARPLLRAAAPMAPTFTDAKAVYPLGFEIPLSI